MTICEAYMDSGHYSPQPGRHGKGCYNPQEVVKGGYVPCGWPTQAMAGLVVSGHACGSSVGGAAIAGSVCLV